MRIAALSDLHIGPRDATDVFQHRLDGFLRFLDELEAAYDRIVLVGDVYQTQHSGWPGRRAAARELRRARQRMAALAERFDSPRYVYVHGNHDAIARDELGALESFTVAHGGRRIHFTHGHQYDPILSRAAPVGHAATWSAGRVRAVGLAKMADWLEARDIALKDRRFRRPGGPYEIAGRALLRHQAANVVVMGHTHVAHKQRVAEGLLVNTGSCSLGQFSWASINAETLQVELHTDARVPVAPLGGSRYAAPRRS